MIKRRQIGLGSQNWRRNTAAGCLTFFHPTEKDDADSTLSDPKLAKEDSVGRLVLPADQTDPLTTPHVPPALLERGIGRKLH